MDQPVMSLQLNGNHSSVRVVYEGIEHTPSWSFELLLLHILFELDKDHLCMELLQSLGRNGELPYLLKQSDYLAGKQVSLGG